MAMTADLNCNMLRIWGGGVYETDTFYDRCDELGIMVWHDFMFGCALYPQTADFLEQTREEAEIIVKRLRHHACMALWSGNNENDVAHDWFPLHSKLNPNDDRISREILPEVLLGPAALLLAEFALREPKGLRTREEDLGNTRRSPLGTAR